jgi:hypothetical protein
MRKEVLQEIRGHLERKITLTPFQLREILTFYGANGEKFGALGNLLNSHEQDVLKECFSGDDSFIPKVSAFGHNILPGLIDYFRESEAREVLEKISRFGELYVITEQDFQNKESFLKLPFIVQYSLSRAGRAIFSQIRDFLNNGGVVTLFVFKKPAPAYVEVLNERAPNVSLAEKVDLALRIPDGDKELKTASHQFITINFIPSKEEKQQPEKVGNFAHLRKVMNPRIDELEEKYARMVLSKFLAEEEMREVIWTLAALTCASPFFYVINNFLDGNFLAQTTIKVLTHLISNLVNVYLQYKAHLEGEKFLEEIGDFFKKLPHMKEAIGGIGGGFILDPLSEVIGQLDRIGGAFVFGLEALVGSLLTTVNLIKERKSKGYYKGIKDLLHENPAVLGMNIGAVASLLASVGILGLLDKFHNPTAVALVGGMTEPMVAALTIKLYTAFRYQSDFYKKGKELIERRLQIWGN